MSKILNMLMAFVMSFGISGSNVNPSDIPENSNFEVHFIDVGQGDSSLIITQKSKFFTLLVVYLLSIFLAEKLYIQLFPLYLFVK